MLKVSVSITGQDTALRLTHLQILLSYST